MKTKWTKAILLLFLLMFSLTLSDCKKEKEIADDYVFDISQETDWDYWMVAKDGSSFAVQLRNSVPAYVYYKPVNEHNGYVIALNEQGIPESTVIDNQIFLFGNYRKDKVDISVVLPNGTIKIFQDISIPYDLTPLLTKGSKSQAIDWSEIDYLKWSGKGAGIVACGLGLAATAATGGIALELAVIGCSSTIVGIAADLIDLEVVGLSSDVVGIVTTFVSCTSINVECLLNLYETGMDIRDFVILYESENQNEIDIAADLLTGAKVADIDNNIYTTIIIGTQVWMKENLKTTKLNDGTTIQNITSDISWNGLSSPAYCWYKNNEATYKATYGALYNWYAVNTGKLCPSGWHVPSDVEWHTLALAIDPNAALASVESLLGGKLKETGTSHWGSPNTGATNESGFSAVAAGNREDNIAGGYDSSTNFEDL